MISYDDFSIMLKEELILTHPLIKSSKIIERIVGGLPYWHKINFDFDKNVFDIDFDGILTNGEMEYLNHELNKIGYYPSYYKIINKSNMVRGFHWSNLEEYLEHTKNRKSVQIFFESRFDEKLKYQPEFLYHCTKIDNLYKIKKQGLRPLYKEKGDFRPDRIYLSLSYKDILEILKMLKFRDMKNDKSFEYVVLKIETKNIYNLDLYKDPRSKGVYTYNHINPNCIEIIKDE